jgi:UDP-2,3-diacylglucosamine pyrophosphatase LpxH
MSQDRRATHQKLSNLWQDSNVHVLETRNQKFAVISDLHLGGGNGADDFRNNEQAMVTALEHYRTNGYHLILLGDVEELWQFDLEEIVKRYGNSIYQEIRKFGDNRVLRVFGNHDSRWGVPCDPAMNERNGSGYAAEAIKLKDENGEVKILLVHGHQGSEMSDKKSWLSKFFVRLFRYVEPFLRRMKFYRNPSTADSRIVKDYERIFYAWAKENRAMVICGHSHRAIFASKSYCERVKEEIAELKSERELFRNNRETAERCSAEIKEKQQIIKDERYKGREIKPLDPDGESLPCYFNTGCALYTDGITAMEIADGQIKLVKWYADKHKNTGYEVYQSDRLDKFIREVTGDVETNFPSRNGKRRSGVKPGVKVTQKQNF